PIAEITRQYMKYIELMQELRLELAAEYLVMAALLAEIKSRMLLPRVVQGEAEEDDPRAELIRRLQEYERFKEAAADLDEIPRLQRDIFTADAETPKLHKVQQLPQIELPDLLTAFREVMRRAEMFSHHHIQLEALSVRERMSLTLDVLRADKFCEFSTLFTVEEGRMGVVVTLLALLELIRESLVELVQSEPFAPIHVRLKEGEPPVQLDMATDSA
ncbi:MAG: segregation/condensation protein A, partial [Gammaproteobacteria bacterium]